MEDKRYNNGIPSSEIAERKPALPKRVNWNKLALVFILLGAALVGIGSITGTRGGGLYFTNGRFQVLNTVNESSFTPIPDGFDLKYVTVNGNSIRVIVEPTPWGRDNGVEVVNVSEHEVKFNDDGGIVVNARNTGSHSGWAVMNFSNPLRNEIRISLPAGKNLDTLNVTCTSGSIRIDGMNAHNITAVANSGAIRLNDSQAENFTARATSGVIRGDNLRFTDGNFQTSSGGITLSNTHWQNLEVRCTSGVVRVTESQVINPASGTTTLQTSSGGVTLGIRGNRHDYNYSVSTSSGTARVNGESIFNGSIDTTSNLTANAGSGNHQISIRTTSGYARLNFE